MTANFPIKAVEDDVDLNSRDALMGGCLQGIVTERKLQTDTGKAYKLCFLKGYKQISCSKTFLGNK